MKMTVQQVQAMCQERLDKALSHGPLSKGYDLDNYRGGEIEGWRTVLRVLANIPPTHNPAQAIYTLAGFNMDRSTAPKDRLLYDRERGFMDSREHNSWILSWNRVISRVQGWLESEYGPAEYEQVKDLPSPPLPYLDRTTPEYQADQAQSVAAMLGNRGAPK